MSREVRAVVCLALSLSADSLGARLRWRSNYLALRYGIPEDDPRVAALVAAWRRG